MVTVSVTFFLASTIIVYDTTSMGVISDHFSSFSMLRKDISTSELALAFAPCVCTYDTYNIIFACMREMQTANENKLSISSTTR